MAAKGRYAGQGQCVRNLVHNLSVRWRLRHFFLTVTCIWRKLNLVRSLATYALLGTFFLIGSGALEYVHNWAHELEDRLNDQAEAAAAPIPPANLRRLPVHREHEHDENNCEVHAQLHMAIIVYSWTSELIWLGVWIAFLTLLAVPLIPRLLPVRIDCRGPPRWPLSNSF